MQSGYMYLHEIKAFRTLDFKGDLPDQKGLKILNNDNFSAFTVKFLHTLIYDTMKKDFDDQWEKEPLEVITEPTAEPPKKKKNKKKKKEVEEEKE
jgi:hypothetical protein